MSDAASVKGAAASADMKSLLRDPDYTPPVAQAVPLGIQHVLAMFASNVTPAIIVAGAAGFGFGSNSPDFPNLIYMIQMSMLFAGIATLFQSIGMGRQAGFCQTTAPACQPSVTGWGLEERERGLLDWRSD